MNVVEFVRSSDHAGLLHLSTCYVAARGRADKGRGRPNYTPAPCQTSTLSRMARASVDGKKSRTTRRRALKSRANFAGTFWKG